MPSEREIRKTTGKRNVLGLSWRLCCGWHPDKYANCLVPNEQELQLCWKERKCLRRSIASYKHARSSGQLSNLESNQAYCPSLRHLSAPPRGLAQGGLATLAWPHLSAPRGGYRDSYFSWLILNHVYMADNVLNVSFSTYFFTCHAWPEVHSSAHVAPHS